MPKAAFARALFVGEFNAVHAQAACTKIIAATVTVALCIRAGRTDAVPCATCFRAVDFACNDALVRGANAACPVGITVTAWIVVA